jgi:hypothetical protein
MMSKITAIPEGHTIYDKIIVAPHVPITIE